MSYFEQTKVTDSDGAIITPAKDVTIKDLYYQMALLLDRLDYGMITDNAKRLKVNLVDSGALATVTTVATVSAVTNTIRQGDLQMQRVNEAMLDTAFINGITNNIKFV